MQVLNDLKVFCESGVDDSESLLERLRKQSLMVETKTFSSGKKTLSRTCSFITFQAWLIRLGLGEQVGRWRGLMPMRAPTIRVALSPCPQVALPPTGRRAFGVLLSNWLALERVWQIQQNWVPTLQLQNFLKTSSMGSVRNNCSSSNGLMHFVICFTVF